MEVAMRKLFSQRKKTPPAELSYGVPEEVRQRFLHALRQLSGSCFTADPPANQGESRFEVEFGIDSNKRLVISARDIAANKTVLRDYPVVKLT
jgi:molecular chaperone DnaK